jgi:hypothetical protein
MPSDRLPFCIVSKAYCAPGQPPPIEGMRHLAEAVHAHHLPVTWIVEPEGARALQRELAEWHGAFGDEIAMALVGLPVEAASYRQRREILQSLCPWSEVIVSGQGGGKTEAMVAALEAAGLRGHWGYCWEQTYVDGITDYGHTPGLFHISQQSYKMPRPGGGGLVAVEWLSRDLNKAFWTGNPVHFAGEPDAFKVMGDWSDEESIRYFLHVVDQYARNARAGQPLPFIFQEEAEQLMERLGGVYTGVWPKLIRWISQALGQVVAREGTRFTTLPAVVSEFAASAPCARLYRASDEKFSLLNDPRFKPHLRIYGAAFAFPEVLHYCSERIFATFRQGSQVPLRMIRYDRQQPCDVSTPLEGEAHLPVLKSFRQEGPRWIAEVEAREAMPYALCLPLSDGAILPEGAPINEDAWAWELQLRPGTHTYATLD